MMQGDTPLRWWQTRGFAAAATLLATLPLLWPDVPPLVDLPGHMGRYRVQLAIGEVPALRDWFAFRWQLIGNLGIDLLIEPLAPILGLETTVKLIVIACPAMIVGGLLWIAREVHGRIPPTALFALPLAYSYPFHFGFVNFALSMGIALPLFALWLRLGRLQRFGVRAAIFVVASPLLWLCHTFGWGVLGVLAFSAELVRQHDAGRRWFAAWFHAVIGVLPIAPPMLLMVAWRSGHHVGGQTFDWFNWRAKVTWVLMILRDRWMPFDVAATAILFLVLFKGFRDPKIEYSRHLGLSALFLLAVFLVLPRVVFGSAYADMRLAPFMVAIALIAIRPRVGMTMRGASMLALAGLAFFLVRIGGTTASFWLYDRSYDRNLAALDHIPVGARLVSFVGDTCQNEWFMSRLEHLPGLALERRLAYSNDQWSMAGAQLLATRYRAAQGFAHDPSQIVTSSQCPREFWRPIGRSMATFPRDAFDYVWQIETPAYDPRYNRGLKRIWHDGDSAVWRVDRSQPQPVFDIAAFAPPRG